jgi:hypothetical protein
MSTPVTSGSSKLKVKVAQAYNPSYLEDLEESGLRSVQANHEILSPK